MLGWTSQTHGAAQQGHYPSQPHHRRRRAAALPAPPASRPLAATVPRPPLQSQLDEMDAAMATADAERAQKSAKLAAAGEKARRLQHMLEEASGQLGGAGGWAAAAAEVVAAAAPLILQIYKNGSVPLRIHHDPPADQQLTTTQPAGACIAGEGARGARGGLQGKGAD